MARWLSLGRERIDGRAYLYEQFAWRQRGPKDSRGLLGSARSTVEEWALRRLPIERAPAIGAASHFWFSGEVRLAAEKGAWAYRLIQTQI